MLDLFCPIERKTLPRSLVLITSAPGLTSNALKACLNSVLKEKIRTVNRELSKLFEDCFVLKLTQYTFGQIELGTRYSSCFILRTVLC